MKKTFKDVLLMSITIVYFIYIIVCSSYIKEQVVYSFKIWMNGVVPSLFSSFILIDLINISNISYYLRKYFHINIYYILAIIGGSPSNTLLISKYGIDKTKLLVVSNYISILFLYNNLKYIFNRDIAIILILCNILCNFIIYLFIKPRIVLISKDSRLSSVILNIKDNMMVLIGILGIVAFFNTLPLFLLKNSYIKCFISSMLEVTTFFNYVSLINVPIKFKLLCSMIAISTCGLCIECQIKSILKDTSIDYKYYLFYRLIHLIMYVIMVFIVIGFIV